MKGPVQYSQFLQKLVMSSTAKVKWLCFVDTDLAARKSRRIILRCQRHSSTNYLNSLVSITPGKVNPEGILLKLSQQPAKLALSQQFCLFIRWTATSLLKSSSKCFEGHCNHFGMSCSKGWIFSDLSSLEKQIKLLLVKDNPTSS